MATKDSELDAMGKVSEALESLETEVQERVLRWAAERHGIALPASSRRQSQQNDGGGDVELDDREFADLGDLWGAASPSTDEDRALVVSYWFQEVEGKPTVNAQQVNKELKNFGHGVAKITRTFDRLVATRPQQVIQTKKTGTAQQGRKEFKVTKVGIEHVKQLIAGTGAQ